MCPRALLPTTVTMRTTPILFKFTICASNLHPREEYGERASRLVLLEEYGMDLHHAFRIRGAHPAHSALLAAAGTGQCRRAAGGDCAHRTIETPGNLEYVFASIRNCSSPAAGVVTVSSFAVCLVGVAVVLAAAPPTPLSLLTTYVKFE